MKKMSETIVFFGSGPVAAESLRLIARNFEIEAVVTKPKPPHHRGDFPVIALAEDLGLKVMTASNKRELTELFSVKPFDSRVAVLIDFGIIVSQEVIDYFPLGIVNSHFSLLPEWRGADPITFSLLSGQPKTGVTLMLIDAGMDTGKVLVQKSLPIEAGDTAMTLTAKLIELSNDLLASHLSTYVSGELKPRSQPHPDRATYSRKLTKDDGKIDWSKPAEQIEREIRAFLEWPKSQTVIAGKEVVITKAAVIDADGPAGKFEALGNELIGYCGEKALAILELKPSGKTAMSAEAFLAGYRRLL